MSLCGKKKALMKILYHGYLQAILQQERFVGACFHKCASHERGGLVDHNQCDVKAMGQWRQIASFKIEDGIVSSQCQLS